MVIDNPNPSFALRFYRVNFEFECLITFLGRESGIIASLFLVFVDAFCFSPANDFAVDVALADRERNFGEACADRKRESIDCLEILIVRVDECLGHLRLGKAVVDGDLDMMIENSDRRMRRTFRRQSSRCLPFRGKKCHK